MFRGLERNVVLVELIGDNKLSLFSNLKSKSFCHAALCTGRDASFFFCFCWCQLSPNRLLFVFVVNLTPEFFLFLFLWTLLFLGCGVGEDLPFYLFVDKYVGDPLGSPKSPFSLPFFSSLLCSRYHQDRWGHQHLTVWALQFCKLTIPLPMPQELGAALQTCRLARRFPVPRLQFNIQTA